MQMQSREAVMGEVIEGEGHEALLRWHWKPCLSICRKMEMTVLNYLTSVWLIG
jgi:hypothetical protein